MIRNIVSNTFDGRAATMPVPLPPDIGTGTHPRRLFQTTVVTIVPCESWWAQCHYGLVITSPPGYCAFHDSVPSLTHSSYADALVLPPRTCDVNHHRHLE